MRYRPETFALYTALFTEAHQTLVKESAFKEARIFRSMGRRLQQGWRGLTGAAEKETAQLSDAVINQEAAMKELQREQAAAVANSAKQTTARGAAEDAVRAAKEQAAAQQAQMEAAHGAYRQQAEQEMAQYGAKPGALTSAQRMRNVGLAGAGLGLAGVPAAYYAGQHGAEQQGRTSRNLAFGAGAAAGLAAPQLVSGLGAIANTAGQTGLFPELQGMGFPGQNPQGTY